MTWNHFARDKLGTGVIVIDEGLKSESREDYVYDDNFGAFFTDEVAIGGIESKFHRQRHRFPRIGRLAETTATTTTKSDRMNHATTR